MQKSLIVCTVGNHGNEELNGFLARGWNVVKMCNITADFPTALVIIDNGKKDIDDDDLERDDFPN